MVLSILIVLLPTGGTLTKVRIDASGGAGGNGPGNGQAGCSTTGGSGSNGRRIVGDFNGSATFSHIIGQKGNQGQNIYSGSQTESYTSGGGGAATGGQGGRGAWGNGGSGGGGGGCYFCFCWWYCHCRAQEAVAVVAVTVWKQWWICY